MMGLAMTMHPIVVTASLLFTSAGFATNGLSNSRQQPVQQTTKDNAFDSSFDRFVEGVLRELHVPGISVAVVDNGKIASKVSPYTIFH
jgi:CubicO group peptidase (beta-lactamase class C family)